MLLLTCSKLGKAQNKLTIFDVFYESRQEVKPNQ